MIQLTSFEKELQLEFTLSDRDARRMDRVVTDIAALVGMDKFEVFDFLKFGCEEELSQLKIDYDWKRLQKSIQFRLKKQT
ncbi:MAG: hypothetical protein O9346_16385 [Leptospiraceae bacterium]|jgi:hypothetical protein|nr:hypothetical protein [Leptospiraceae bacterium]MCZ8347992.1 hypothetical protein [Leptospiraceae bacterium]PJE02655.1 MAG: hypothetical protein CK427_07165 [Leptospira sp.]